MCPGITILHCSKRDVEEVKQSLDQTWCTENGTIHSIPGTRKAHFFIKVAPYTIGFQTITADASDYAEFSFRTGKVVKKPSTDVANKGPTTFNYKQGEWVNVRYDGQCHIGIILNVNSSEKLVNVRCLKEHNNNWWKLKPEIDAVWYTDSDVLGHSEYKPVMDQRGALYKLTE